MRETLVGVLAGLVTKRLLNWLVSQWAFLGWGPVGFVVSFFIQKVIEQALKQTFLGAMIGYIFLEVRSDLNALEKVIKEIGEHEGEITDDTKKEFDKRLATAGRELIRFGTIQ